MNKPTPTQEQQDLQTLVFELIQLEDGVFEAMMNFAKTERSGSSYSDIRWIYDHYNKDMTKIMAEIKTIRKTIYGKLSDHQTSR